MLRGRLSGGDVRGGGRGSTFCIWLKTIYSFGGFYHLVFVGECKPGFGS